MIECAYRRKIHLSFYLSHFTQNRIDFISFFSSFAFTTIMSDTPITKQPESTISRFRLMPNEYIRFEYTYKPGCCCFGSKTTTVTNMRLLTNVIKAPTIFSKKTSSGKEEQRIMYLDNLTDVKQLKSAIPSSHNRWWTKFTDILTCNCSDQNVEWLELCRGIDNLALNTTESTADIDHDCKTTSVEKF